MKGLLDNKFIIFLLLLIISVAGGAVCKAVNTSVDSLYTALEKNPQDIGVLRKLGLYSLNTINDSLSAYYGSKLLEISNKYHNDEAATYGYLILGQTALMKDKPLEGYKYLYDARRLAEFRSDSLSLASIFNGLAIYTYYYTYDLANAINYFYHGLRCAKSAGDNRLYHQLLSNIANVYIEQSDTTGIRYAKECLDYAAKSDEHWLQYTSALCLADMYKSLHDYTRAFHYLSIAEEAFPDIKGYNKGEYYRLKGTIYDALGLVKQAENSFNQAKKEYKSVTARYLNLLVDQARFEDTRNNLPKVKELLDSVLALSSDTSNTKARLAALWDYSFLSEKSGNLADALKYSRDFSALKSSTYYAASSRMLNEAKARYEFDKLSWQLAKHKIDSTIHLRNFYVAVALLALFLVIILSITFYNLRLKKIYRAIVVNMQNSLAAEDALRARIKELEKDSADSKKAPVSHDTLQSVIEGIEILFDRDNVYTNPNLTRDSLADMLGTNTTYITRAIAERYQMSFVQFVNNYRIKEAMRLLSDPDNDTPIKAIGLNIGYNSPTSFYNHFKDATGMTPAAYRAASSK